MHCCWLSVAVVAAVDESVAANCCVAGGIGGVDANAAAGAAVADAVLEKFVAGTDVKSM